MNSVGSLNLYLANFRPTLAGKISDVFYTIFNSDGTVFTARTQSGVVEFLGGGYGVNLSFATVASYEIHWDIDGISNAKANEEINIFDFSSQVVYDLIPL